MRNPWMIGALAATCLMTDAVASTAPPAHLEKIIMNLASDPEPVDVPQFTQRLGIEVAKPTLMDDYTSIGSNGIYHYPASPNPWGVTAVERIFKPDASGLREATTSINLLLDQTYCLKPADFPKRFGLKLNKLYVPSPHGTGPGSYEINFATTTADLRVTTVASTDEHACATQVSIYDTYRKHADKRGDAQAVRSEEPFIGSMPWTNELANNLSLHPPYSADAFLQKTMTLIRAHDGYIAPDELNAAFGVHAPQAMPDRLGHYELKAHQDWYLHLDYWTAPASYKSVQPNVYPNGEGTVLSFQFQTYTFNAPSGEPQCFARQALADELTRAGWTLDPAETQDLKSLAGQPELETIVYRKGKLGSNVSITSLSQATQRCVIELKIIGARAATPGDGP